MNKKAFTLVELIVWIFIISLLISVSFFAYSNYSKTARNSFREVSINNIKIFLEAEKTANWKLFLPDNYAELKSSIWTFSYQWNLPRDYFLEENINDPLLDSSYYYSVSWNLKNYGLAYIYEGEKWNQYKYEWWENPVFFYNNSFVFSDLDFSSLSSAWYEMYSKSWKITWDDILLAWKTDVWILSSCYEYISSSNKSLSDWDYLLSLESWIFKAKCDMTTSSWWWTRVFYSDSDSFEFNIENDSFDFIANESVYWNNNYSILYDMLWKKAYKDYFFMIKDSNVNLVFSQSLSYLDNPNVWNNYKFISWTKTFSPSSALAWPYFWLFLWKYWDSDMQANCYLTTSYSWWVTFQNCVKDSQNASWIVWTFNTVSSPFIEIWQK